MKHISLFSGIGGFDLASEWMGWENVAHCEWNSFGQKILKYYWPNAISYEDITKTDFNIHRGRIDILTGGFPCQPYSVAGKRKGKEDERHLWPEMLRAIREIQPSWIVGENVRGLVNWDGGLVFEEVQADLEAEGYEVLPFLLPACSTNAPHQRERIWFIAYSNNKRRPKRGDNGKRKACKQKQENGNEIRNNIRSTDASGFTSNSNGVGLWRQINRLRKSRFFNKNGTPDDWENFPIEHPVYSGNDGFSSKLDGITFSKWRNESIKAGGNAIVPQVAYQIFKAIQEYENLNHENNN